VAGVENQIGKLTALEANRGVWRSLLGEISGALVEGMWLTRVAPVETLPGEAAPAAAPDDRRPGRGNPAASAPVPTDVIAGLEIEGMGYLDKIKSDQITEFRNKLRESELFSDQTEIVWQPPARPDAATLEFKILAVLEAPKEL